MLYTEDFKPINRRIKRKVIKSIKKDLKQVFKESSQMKWAFNNLIERIKFLKKLYGSQNKSIEESIEEMINMTALKIKELFE